MIQNATVFYAPIWLGNYQTALEALKRDPRFSLQPKQKLPQYMMSYATDIYRNDSLYCAFVLKPEHIPRLSLYVRRLNLEEAPVLESVRLSCFGTGCAFAEFRVTYGELPVEQIMDFAFLFKNATRADTDNGDGLTMCGALEQLLSGIPGVELFFAGSGFKRECRMFHQIFCREAPKKAVLHQYLRKLSRGYYTRMAMPESDSEYDMEYHPYSNDHWAGSQEGLVNLYYYDGQESTRFFIDRYKTSHLIRNYHFLYLLLLNQRFTAIKLISRITEYGAYTPAEKEDLNRRIVELKTVYTFKIISDDLLYQNVYKRMYGILDVDRLLEDIRDNEQHVALIRNYEAPETEKPTGRLLPALSLLSVFAVVIHVSGYFDRSPLAEEICTGLSFACVLTIAILCAVWWILHRRK